MEWVEGITLLEWVRRQVQAGAAAELRAMADRWTALVRELKQYRIAHGDLQHDNILVVGGQLRLVDYDGMCVPALVGRPAAEDGLPAYQHPGRSGQPLSLALDDFSAWVILLALRAAAADPGLWLKCLEEADNDNLLFASEDIDAPDRSPLWPALDRSPDAEVRQWAQSLRESLGRPFDQIPPFEMGLGGKQEIALKRLRAAAAATSDGRLLLELWRGLGADLAGMAEAAAIERVVESWRRRLEAASALAAAVRVADEENPPPGAEAAVVRTWDSLQGVGGHPEGQRWRTRAEAARRRAACLERLRAVAAGVGEDFDRPWVAAWDEATLAGCREADPMRSHLTDARKSLEVLDRLQQLADAGATPEQLAQATRDLPTGYPYRLRTHIEQSQKRDAARRDLDAALGHGHERAIASAWSALLAAGGAARDSAEGQRAEMARRRAPLLEQLEDLAQRSACEAVDRRWCELWDEDVLRHCRQAEALLGRHLEARERTHCLDELRRLAVDGAPAEWLVAAAAVLPDDYPHEYRDLVRSARVAEDLRRALAGPSDVALADAWDAYCHLRLTPPAPAVIEQCIRATQRRERVKRLGQIGPELPLDEQDRLWVQEWDEALLNGCADALPHLRRRRQAAERLGLWQALERAAQAGESRTVWRLHGDARLAGYPPLVARQAELAPLVEAGARLGRLLEALASGDDAAVLAGLDLPAVCAQPGVFQLYRARILAVAAGCLRGVALQPAEPACTLDREQILLSVRWTGWDWPLLGRPDRVCRVAVHPERHLDTPDEAGSRGTFKPRQSSCRSGGCTVLVPSGARRVFVTVWPVIDLSGPLFGRREQVGAPLRLGPIQVR
jgi:hypothetical protein